MRQMANDSGRGLAELKKDSSTQTSHAGEPRVDSGTQTSHAAEPRVDRGIQTLYETFDMARDDDLEEEHEAELAEKEKYKKDRTQAKKDKTKQHLRKNLSKQKAAEDEVMKQTEQEQKDDLEFASAPVTGGASSSQGPLPPKQPRTPKAKVERSRSRDQEPKTPKSEMKSESEATPKVKKEPKEKKIKVKKEIEEKQENSKKQRKKTN